jgi:hypothetical protein
MKSESPEIEKKKKKKKLQQDLDAFESCELIRGKASDSESKLQKRNNEFEH